jgi:hypothetical protein
MSRKGHKARSKKKSTLARASSAPDVIDVTDAAGVSSEAPAVEPVRASEVPHIPEVPAPAEPAEAFDASASPAASADELVPEAASAPTEAAPAEAAALAERPVDDVVAAEDAVEATAPSAGLGRNETPVAFEAPVVQPVERDDSSFPPVDLDSAFFEGTANEQDPSHEIEDRDPRMALKRTPAAARRRAQFTRYVKVAVGAASALCLAALVKVAVAGNHAEPALRHPSAAAQIAPTPAPPQVIDTPAPQETGAAVPEQAAPVAADPPAEPPPAPVAAEPVAPPAATATDVAIAPAENAPVAGDPAAAPAEPAENDVATPDPKEAAKAKRVSQIALERGKVADAIEAGERSVALDPTDAEAWLILGAAYQEKGDWKEARRSFRSCLDQGKRGPRFECAQMPH